MLSLLSICNTLCTPPLAFVAEARDACLPLLRVTEG